MRIKQQSLEELEERGAEPIDEEFEQKLIQHIDMRQALRRLPPMERRVLLLHVQGYPTRKIARMLRLDSAKVKAALDSAIQQMRELLRYE